MKQHGLESASDEGQEPSLVKPSKSVEVPVLE